MSSPRETKIENAIIALLQMQTPLAAVTIVNHDDDDGTTTARIIVKATQGTQNLAGPQGFMYEIEVTPRQPNGANSTLETWKTEIEAAFAQTTVASPSAALTAALTALGCTYFGPDPEQSQDASRLKQEKWRGQSYRLTYIVN